MNSIVKKSEHFIRQKLEVSLPKEISYHNILHTLTVVNALKKIGRYYNLTPAEKEILLIAGWFHDIGILQHYNDHEIKSAKICAAFLKKQNYPLKKIKKIEKIIRSTKIPQKPKNLLEKILCDADISHIGRRNFESRSQLLRAEWEKTINKKFTDREWIETNILFLQKNNFHTKAAKLLFEKKRNENLEKLNQKLLNYKITPPPKHKSLS